MTLQRHARRLRSPRRFKRTVAFRITKWDSLRIEKVFRKYKVPWGISKSAGYRALFRILAAEKPGCARVERLEGIPTPATISCKPGAIPSMHV